MWLLNARTHNLEYFASEAEEDYAILSHTWDEEEILFQDMLSGNSQKKGHAKILSTCRRALEDGYKYIWIDTCCINKESSSELTEAINSMWRFYCQAQVCYVFLSDLSENCPELHDYEDQVSDKDMPGASPWNGILGCCRWFSRGWTLQELIAPKTLLFFNRGWECIGSKRSLSKTLARITGVDKIVLDNSDVLLQLTIARRMSWAANRATSRVEDRAYSLMGIFDIQMPLLYGEGTKAFIRLQEEIVRTCTDHSVFAWEYAKLGRVQVHDHVFANSPCQFSHAGKVVPWSGDWIDQPYRLTNRGVYFDSLLVRTDQSRYFGILNCRYEDNLAGPIALRLRRGEKSAIPVVAEDYWVYGVPGSSSTSSRTTVVEIENVKTSPIQLLRYPPTLISGTELITPPKIWLRSSTRSSFKFSIIEAYPNDQWNFATGMMCLPLGSIPEGQFAWVRLGNETGQTWKMFFSFEKTASTRAQLPAPETFAIEHQGFRMLMLDAQTEISVQNVISRIEIIPRTWEATILLSREEIHASVRRASIMGDQTYVVEIDRNLIGL